MPERFKIKFTIKSGDTWGTHIGPMDRRLTPVDPFGRTVGNGIVPNNPSIALKVLKGL